MRDLFDKLMQDNKSRREHDAKRFNELDGDLCQLCHAYGADKRSLFIDCFYDIHEVVPEAIDLFAVEGELMKRGYYLRICKACRGALLGHLQQWRQERIALRDVPKDHDGNPEESDGDTRELIPVRINGATIMMNEYEYSEYKRKREQTP